MLSSHVRMTGKQSHRASFTQEAQQIKAAVCVSVAAAAAAAAVSAAVPDAHLDIQQMMEQMYTCTHIKTDN